MTTEEVLKEWIQGSEQCLKATKTMKDFGYTLTFTENIKDGKYYVKINNIEQEISYDLYRKYHTMTNGVAVEFQTVKNSFCVFTVRTKNTDTILHKHIKAILDKYNLVSTMSGVLDIHRNSVAVYMTLADSYTYEHQLVRAAGVLENNFTEPEIKTGVVQFIGFNTWDGSPIFRSYRSYEDMNDPTKNTFGKLETVAHAFTLPVRGTPHLGGLRPDEFTIEFISQ